MTTDLSSNYSRDMGTGEDLAICADDTSIILNENLLEKDLAKKQWVKDRSSEEWIKQVFSRSAVFEGVDELIWGRFLVCVYKDPNTGKISSLILDSLGITHFNPVDISSQSQYYPAVENLNPKDKESNVRKCMAVSLLRKFAQLEPELIAKIQPNGLKFDYDPTHAGDLASRCKLIDYCSPENIGRGMLSLGLLQQRSLHSTLLDVVYERKESLTDINNKLVFHLGEQLEQLFNPLTEYSPEQTEYTYKAPDQDQATEEDNHQINSIIGELLQLQTNFTLTLVEFLQGFLINLRIKVLNEEIEGLSTVKLNRLFPPTIDEVTRINCIFLDSLKSAKPFGSLEVLKACSVTIPYFYKAYTRHEAATKNFSKDFKLFVRNFNESVPRKDEYSDMKIESIINGPQEKLMKLKLIIDRLYQEKDWLPNEEVQAKEKYNNIVEAIDSFGKMESPLSSYNTRVFTPSGKILTELAKGWPEELQYKWLKRRVVGVYDIIDKGDTTQRQILVIFSDYIVFLEIVDGHHYYADSNNNKPRIADILMNSLINEVPLPSRIPKLKVRQYSYIDEIMVAVLEDNGLRFDAYRRKNSFSLSFELSSSSTSASSVADLVAKAKILEKETAFHLFKAVINENVMYSTAHELEAYRNENLKSKCTLFLNIKPSRDILEQHKLHVAIFAKFIDNIESKDVQLDILTSDGRTIVSIVPPEKIVTQIFKQLSIELPIYYSSINSPLLSDLLAVNELLLLKVGRNIGCIKEPDGDVESALELFNKDHEKKKSFGTITTFRSYASDYKDVTSHNSRESDVLPAKKIAPKSAPKRANKKPNTKVPKAAVKDSHEKRRSFIGVLKGILGSKNAKNRSKLNSSATEQKKNIIPILPHKNHDINSNKKVISPDTSRMQKTGEADERSSRRITSVIRNTNFDSRKEQKTEEACKVNGKKDENESKVQSDTFRDAIQPGTEQVRTKQQETKQTQSIQTETIQTEVAPQKAEQQKDEQQQNDQPNLSQPEKQFIYTRRGKDSPDEAFKSLVLSLNTDSVTRSEEANSSPLYSSNFYKGESRQSQLFNEDLFGDIALAKAQDEKTLRIEGKQNNYQHNEENGQASSTLDSEKSSGSSIQTHDSSNTETAPEMNTSMENVEKSNSYAKKVTQEKRNQIFPTFAIQEPQKINIERSPSFIELFKGMMLILDETDAQYNWRRLSSEASPTEKHMINYDQESSHVFKSIAETKDRKNEQKLMDQNSEDLTKEHRKELSPVDSTLDGSEDISLQQNNANLSEIIDSSEHLELDNRNTTALSDSHQKPMSIPFTIPNFRVLKTSPAKIVKKSTKRSESLDKDENITYDFSISSDLNMAANKRWIELNLPSQEDLQDDEFHGETQQSTREALEVDEHSSISECDEETNETSQDTSMDDSYKLKDPEALIEDLEFSSFHMTFDTSCSNEGSPHQNSSAKILSNNALAVGQFPIMKQMKQEPIFYRLPKDGTLTSKSISHMRGGLYAEKVDQFEDSNADDDPIWVSPSKINFYDLSTLPEVTGPRNRDKQKLPHREYETKEPHIDTADIAHLRELSYAYLASFVDSDQESDKFDDKPIRLQFLS